MTDVCFICWAIFIISSAIFSCKFWWYCRTESMLSSFASLFLLPVNLQEKRLSKTSSLHGRHYMYSLYGLRVSSFGMIQVRDHSAISYFQIERSWVRVDLLWDKQHEIHVVRKSTLRLWNMWSLVSIAPISNKIQLFVNLKITFIRDVHVWIAGHIVHTPIYIIQYRPDKHQTWECC